MPVVRLRDCRRPLRDASSRGGHEPIGLRGEGRGWLAPQAGISYSSMQLARSAPQHNTAIVGVDLRMQFHAGLRGRRPFALVARALAGGALGLALISMPATTRGQAAARPLHISATSRDAALDWDRQIGRFTDAGTLRLAKSRPDTVMEGRTHDRFDQYYGAARVFGAQLVRQSDGAQAVSVFGTIHPDIAIDATPALTMEQARARAVALDRRSTAAGSRARTARPAARRRRERAVRAGVAGPRRDARRRLQPVPRREDRRRGPAHHAHQDAVRRRQRPRLVRRRKEDQRQPRRLDLFRRRPAAAADDCHARHARQPDADAQHPGRVHQPGAERHRQRHRQQLDGYAGARRARVSRLDLRLLLQALRPPRPRQQRSADSRDRASGVAFRHLPAHQR